MRRVSRLKFSFPEERNGLAFADDWGPVEVETRRSSGGAERPTARRERGICRGLRKKKKKREEWVDDRVERWESESERRKEKKIAPEDPCPNGRGAFNSLWSSSTFSRSFPASFSSFCLSVFFSWLWFFLSLCGSLLLG